MLLLDTCSWLWYVNGNAEFSTRGEQALRKAERLFVSVISVWEVANLVALGRIGLSLDLDTWIHRALSTDRIEPAASRPPCPRRSRSRARVCRAVCIGIRRIAC